VIKIGIVIPTAYTRPEYLPLSYESIVNQQGGFEITILVGTPAEKIEAVKSALPTGAEVIAESNEPGLARKLDLLLRELPKDCDLIGWLGDDDLLTPGSLAASVAAFEANKNVVMTYGGCDYIDAHGEVIFTNSSGEWASKILRFGPQLIPQPGSLMRRRAFEATKGLSNEFALAFDFDLLLKLKNQGKFEYINQTLAQFRWHPTSLSVKRRMRSAAEASRVRRRHYRSLARLFWWLWEPLVILATWAAGKLVSLRTNKKSIR
jgi:GT2 family glycosyltransferase